MKLNNELSKSGLKNTRHRNAILNILTQNGCPMSPKEIFVQMKRRDTIINMSTIYRALKSLTEKEILVKILIQGETKALYQINNKKHCHYLVCLGCKKVVSIEHCLVKEGYEADLNKSTGFTIEEHNLEVFGYCPKCHRKN